MRLLAAVLAEEPIALYEAAVEVVDVVEFVDVTMGFASIVSLSVYPQIT